MQELHHKASKSLESSGDANRGRNFNQDALGGVDVNLKLASFVDGRIQKGQ